MAATAAVAVRLRRPCSRRLALTVLAAGLALFAAASCWWLAVASGGLHSPDGGFSLRAPTGWAVQDAQVQGGGAVGHVVLSTRRLAPNPHFGPGLPASGAPWVRVTWGVAGPIADGYVTGTLGVRLGGQPFAANVVHDVDHASTYLEVYVMHSRGGGAIPYVIDCGPLPQENDACVTLLSTWRWDTGSARQAPW